MSNTDISKFNKDLGWRLKAVRLVYNEGIKLSVEQFAHLIDITPEKLQNYETGRSAIPPIVLVSLYNRGINPVFLLTGGGDPFASNNVGENLQNNILLKNINYDSAIKNFITKEKNKEELLIGSTNTKEHSLIPSIIKASAGKIEK